MKPHKKNKLQVHPFNLSGQQDASHPWALVKGMRAIMSFLQTRCRREVTFAFSDLHLRRSATWSFRSLTYFVYYESQ